ncbi:MAG: diphosphomevalonate decarboxylase [Candidatus Woesebacteria bacterium]
MKTTIQASSDVALVKYWGKKDEILRLPENGSISMILEGLDTKTTVEFQSELELDDVLIAGEKGKGEEERVSKHLDRIRKLAGVPTFAKVVSENVFPKGTGLSSSGSGFAALTLAATKALGMNLSQKELSILARQGSGTACRCVCGGFVEWKDGDTSETSYAETIFSKEYFDIRDVVAVVSEGKKAISSTQGHANAKSGIFFQARQAHIQQKIEAVKQAVGKKDFTLLGELVEAEALEFHSILFTSSPSHIAWYPGTIEVILAVQQMRRDGIKAYFTINTGFNVHVLTLPEYETEVCDRLQKLSLVQKCIRTTVGDAPKELHTHLF